jgi:hypothetical protein
VPACLNWYRTVFVKPQECNNTRLSVRIRPLAFSSGDFLSAKKTVVMATKQQWQEWGSQVNHWITFHKKDYTAEIKDCQGCSLADPKVVSLADRIRDDMLAAVGNPYNLEPDELSDRFLAIVVPEY